MDRTLFKSGTAFCPERRDRSHSCDYSIDRRYTMPDMTYQFRCPCCGMWMQGHPAHRGKIIYCESCTWDNQEDKHSFGLGRNSCKSCVTARAEYGTQARDYWQDAKPKL